MSELFQVAVTIEARSDADLGHYFQVDAIWGGVDRPNVGGFAIRRAAVAARLAEAIKAGAVYYGGHVCRDVNGKTYVHAASRVLGRRANADLRKLGY